MLSIGSLSTAHRNPVQLFAHDSMSLHGGASGSGALRGNKNALKHGRYSREAIAERGQIRELVLQARKLILQIK